MKRKTKSHVTKFINRLNKLEKYGRDLNSISWVEFELIFNLLKIKDNSFMYELPEYYKAILKKAYDRYRVTLPKTNQKIRPEHEKLLDNISDTNTTYTDEELDKMCGMLKSDYSLSFLENKRIK